MKKNIVVLVGLIGISVAKTCTHGGLDQKQAIEAKKERIAMIKGQITLYQNKRQELISHIEGLKKSGADDKQLAALQARLASIEKQLVKMFDGLKISENSLKPLTT